MAHVSRSIHMVSKHDNQQHAVVSIPNNTLPQLKDSSVRVQTWNISMSSNNLSYARAGHILHWWDTYPVPKDAPAPYNNETDWGIVPAWGYARVVATAIPEIPEHSVLWGFWPTSSLPVDLELRSAGTPRSWKEVSVHRNQLMTLYNDYEVVLPVPSEQTRDRIVLLKALSSTGFYINRYVFPSSPSSPSTPDAKPIHPLGLPDLPWTGSDADLRSAVVISLATYSKTGKSFAWQLLRHRDTSSSGPLAFLQAASRTDKTGFAATSENIPNRLITYGALPSEETLQWISSFKPQRIVCVDFGADPETVIRFNKLLENSHVLSTDVSLTFIMIGTKPAVREAESANIGTPKLRNMKRIQFNASGVRDAIIAREGASKFADDSRLNFERYLYDVQAELSQIEIRRPFEGASGLYQAWEDIASSKTSEPMVFEFDKLDDPGLAT